MRWDEWNVQGYQELFLRVSKGPERPKFVNKSTETKNEIAGNGHIVNDSWLNRVIYDMSILIVWFINENGHMYVNLRDSRMINLYSTFIVTRFTFFSISQNVGSWPSLTSSTTNCWTFPLRSVTSLTSPDWASDTTRYTRGTFLNHCQIVST